MSRSSTSFTDQVTKDADLEEKLLEQGFTITDVIGHGGFGTIFAGKTVKTKKPVAIKFEKLSSSTLRQEYRVYTSLNKCIFAKGFAQVMWFGVVQGYNTLVMTRLGASLESIMKASPGERLSVAKTMRIAYQLLFRLQTIHEHGFVHRDLKPDNFMFGREAKTRQQIHIIDFGLAQTYVQNDRRPITMGGQHVDFQHSSGWCGTLAFVSSTCHRGYRQTRRDDMESLGFCLVYMAKGSLPWSDITSEHATQVSKRTTNILDLCEGLPPVFEDYFRTVRLLTFKETPPYNALRTAFLRAVDHLPT